METENLRCANEELRENAEASRKVEFSEWKDASITALETVASAAAEADQQRSVRIGRQKKWKACKFQKSDR